MGNLIYAAIASLDGYVEDAEGKFDWAAPDDARERLTENGNASFETLVASGLVIEYPGGRHPKAERSCLKLNVSLRSNILSAVIAGVIYLIIYLATGGGVAGAIIGAVIIAVIVLLIAFAFSRLIGPRLR